MLTFSDANQASLNPPCNLVKVVHFNSKYAWLNTDNGDLTENIGLK